ncbi:hypothetical protein CDIK_0555 [Cucumispora dikerogammari]|nr:hypothetical protein CDIK_0555 [Cucumispora dikerogammari]
MKSNNTIHSNRVSNIDTIGVLHSPLTPEIPRNLSIVFEYIKTLTFRPYSLEGKKTFAVIKSSFLLNLMFISEFIFNYVTKKTIEIKIIVFLLLSYLSYFFCAFSSSKASDIPREHIFIYNFNNCVFLFVFYIIYRTYHFFFEHLLILNVILLNLGFIGFLFCSFVAEGKNVDFFDFTIEISAKVNFLRTVNQSVVCSVVFFGLFGK